MPAAIFVLVFRFPGNSDDDHDHDQGGVDDGDDDDHQILSEINFVRKLL